MWWIARISSTLPLYDHGIERAGDEETGAGARKGFKAEEVDKVLAEGGKVPVRRVLRQRVRYFCDGEVLGTAEFVNEVFAREQERRTRFGQKRETGARRMRGADWGELRVLRDLQKDVIGSRE